MERSGSPPKIAITRQELDRLLAAAGGRERVEDIYPASPVQRGMIYHSRLDPGRAVYASSMAWQLTGTFHRAAFEAAWAQLIARHAIFRTAFLGETLERPMQVVIRDAKLAIAFHDLQGQDPVRQEQAIRALQDESRNKPFDFSRPPLMRVTVACCGDKDHRIIWSCHHALLDGWSVPLVLNELAECWRALARGDVPRLAPVLPYRDYISWIESQDQVAAEAFWRRRLAGIEPQGDKILRGFPGEDSLNPHSDADGRYGSFDFDLPFAAERIEAFARQVRVTPSTIAVAAWALLLARHADSDDTCFGLVLSGRPAELAQVETRIGLFITTLPLRIELPRAATLRDFLAVVQERQLELMTYQYSAPTDVKTWSGIAADAALFSSILVFDNYPRDSFSGDGDADGDGRLDKLNSLERTNYPLSVSLRTRHGLALKLAYDRAVYTDQDIATLTARFAGIIGQMLDQPECLLNAIDWLDPARRMALLDSGRGVQQPEAAALLVPQRISSAASAGKSAEAVCAPSGSVSYGELLARADQIAGGLQKLGVSRGSRVALMLGRCSDQIAAMLAIWRIGAAFVPVDPQAPLLRRIATLQEAAPALAVVCDQSAAEALAADTAETTLPGLVCATPEQLADSGTVGVSVLADDISALDPAYVMFTSGTTGRPKGIVVSHGALANFLQAMAGCIAPGRPLRCAWLTAPTFDISLLEILLPLATGGSVRVFPGGVIDDAAQVVAAASAGAIDLVQATPSGWQVLFAAGLGPAALTVLVGGEAVPAPLAALLAERAREAWHVYGPTETTVWSSAERIVEPASLSIGAPLLNTDLYVLDVRGGLADSGVAGELAIGGSGLAQGYLGRPGRTAEVFVPHPVAAGQRIYRTGDRAVRLADGRIRYLGRKDGQLKLRGQRLESGEVEAALIAAGAHQAKVGVRQEPGADAELVAWVTPARLDGEALRQALRNHLPLSLVPGRIVPLDAMPLNASGKIDERALAVPAQTGDAAAGVPVSALEHTIQAIWQTVLGRDAIGTGTSFFALGGHSLQATRIAAHLSDALSRPVAIRMILENPTICALAAALEAERAEIPKAERGELEMPTPAVIADATPAPPFESLAERLSSQAEESPRRAAIICGGTKLTYRELEQQANRLAHLLIARGAGPETIVALQIERSVEMLVALVAIVKTGAAFLPIDPAYPPERQAYLVEDARAAITVTAETLQDPQLSALPSDPPAPAVLPETLAYVIYTSGSTGRPKGAMVTQLGAINLYRWYARRYEIEEGRRVLVATSYSFDLTLKNLLTPLLFGGTVVLAPAGIIDGTTLYDLIDRNRVELVNCTPSQFYPMIEEKGALPMGLEFAILGGEPIRCAQLLPIGPGNAACTYINSYGPTECADVTIDGVVAMPGDPGYEVPLGQPIDNVRCLVLDTRQDDVAAGETGELFLAGTCVGRGYLNRPALTAERFLPDPAGGGGRMYRTGDLIRCDEAGTFYFAGRTDHQVKVRGYRIELAEVELAMERHPEVGQAVVVSDGVSLGAHYTGAADLTDDALRAHLAAILPEYMVPSVFARHDALPLTPSGKLDRQALTMPEGPASGGARGGAGRPLDTVEQIVAATFAEQLGLDDVRAEDSFFKLGGHSLLAMRVVAKLRDVLAMDIALQLLFDEPSVEGFAARLSAAGAKPAATLLSASARPDANVPARAPGMAQPLSFAQERMLFLEQFGSGGPAYNVPIVVRLRGKLDCRILAEAFDRLIERHEILRTCFVTTEDGAFQYIGSPWAMGLVPEPTASGDLDAEVARTLRTRLDLVNGRPLVARLLQMSADDHVLIVVLHHIATDAWSNDLLVTDLSRLYAALSDPQVPLPPAPAGRYLDWAARQRATLSPQRLDALLEWWRRQLDGAPSRINFPLDRPRPPAPSFRGARVPVTIDAASAAQIEAMARSAGATPFMAYLALFAIQLARWTGDADMVIGTPIANRDTREIQSVVGLFLNTLAVRIDVTGAESFPAVLERVRIAALDGYSHMELPFEKLVEFLKPARDPSINPVFQSMYVMQHQGTPDPDAPAGEVTIEPVGLSSTTAKFDFSLLLTKTPAGILGAIEYATDLFDQQTVERFAADLIALADKVAADIRGGPDRPLPREAPPTGTKQGMLVSLTNGDMASPLFCIPPAGGTAAGYIPLALRLSGSGIAMLGFDAQALADDPASIPMTVEGFAEIYLRELERVQPAGPVNLLGYSVGGAIAFEMAGRLKARGREINALILIDAYIQNELIIEGPALDRVTWEVCAAVYLRGNQATGAFVQQLPRLKDNSAIAKAMQAALRQAGVRAPSLEDVERVFVTTRALVHAAKIWEPQYYPDTIQLVLATKLRAKPIDLSLDEWRAVAKQVNVETIEASHIQMLDNDVLPQLANIIVAVIDKSWEGAMGHESEDEFCIGDA